MLMGIITYKQKCNITWSVFARYRNYTNDIFGEQSAQYCWHGIVPSVIHHMNKVTL